MPHREKRRRPAYTLGEGIVNSVSHGLGAALAAAGTAILIVYAAWHHNVWAIVSCAVYGASLFLLYMSSTLYHSFQQPSVKALFRIFDHCTIFLLIAGTYTPITLVTLRGSNPALGWTLFGVVWAAAVVGIVLTAIDLERFKLFSMICYVAMGWVIVVAIRPLMAVLPVGGLWLLVSGGLAYTVGITFFVIHVRYMHSIWHFFVLAGSVLHFLAILLYVI